MSTNEPQLVDQEEFIDLLDYEFLGDKATQERKRLFLEGYRIKATVYHGAQYAGIARQTVYKWLDADKVFAEAFADCQDDTADVLESSVYERALGIGGRPDSLLAMFWLKAHRPKFRDRTTIDLQLVDSEIKQRLQALDLKQLPAAFNISNDPATIPVASKPDSDKSELNEKDQVNQQDLES